MTTKSILIYFMKNTFISAEIGINHNGDLDICKKLIEVAKSSGCDAVKFQKRDIDLVYTPEYLSEKRESPWGSTQRDQKSGLEFDLDQYKEIDKFCNSLDIAWYLSAWDLNSLSFINKFNLKHNKVASAMIVDKNFLEECAKLNKYTFISTGMSEMIDIENAVEIFKKHNCEFELMHTVSTYPMEDEVANLNMIRTLIEKFKCKVGYSGHEKGVVISVAAAAIGATSIERHITLDRTMYGSDQAASLEPNGLKNLVDQVRKIDIALGDGIKNVSEAEKEVAKKLRQHIS